MTAVLLPFHLKTSSLSVIFSTFKKVCRILRRAGVYQRKTTSLQQSRKSKSIKKLVYAIQSIGCARIVNLPSNI